MVAAQDSHRRLARLCSSSVDAKQLRLDALEEIARVVGFDAHVWLMTDPGTAVGVAPLADVPCLPELPTAIRLKYVTEVNRWTSLGAGRSPVGLLRDATDDDPGQSPQWRGILNRYGIRDVASVVFSDRFGTWGFLDLWRNGSEPFDATDADYLRSIVEPLTAALRLCQAQTFTVPATPERRELGPVVVLLDEGLRVLSQTAASQEWLEVLLPPGPGQLTVPASVYNVAAQLLAVEQGVDAHPPTARVHLADGFWVTLRAARLTTTDPAEHGVIAVTIEEASATERLEVYARAFGLSRRETEVLTALTAGGDTRTLARRVHISAYTFQDHLKAIFAKTGTHDRKTLLSRAVGR